eukprot:GEMP01077893.1.p1 GENE.GEMP01077893.1~~GEMP01077893.1.p1  ORF type:complete len:188 (+),score=24.55 GEMP01077893.1:115-678(+)
MLSVLRAGAQSGSILFVGDLLAQHVWANPWDYKRSAQWGVLGLCLHGPWFLMSFRKIDAFFGPATNMATVLKKTAAAQCLAFPPYLCGFFIALGFMEGKNTHEVSLKLRTSVPDAFAMGCIFWPIANIVNFRLVPNTARVPCLATAAIVWNIILSTYNSQPRPNEEEFGSVNPDPAFLRPPAQANVR